jgi:hypothetical protein
MDVLDRNGTLKTPARGPSQTPAARFISVSL